MNFLVDEQLPPFLARKLTDSGYNATHVRDRPEPGSSDSIIAAWARDNQAVIITKDLDFVQQAGLGKLHVPIIWIRFGNTANEQLWSRFVKDLPRLQALLAAGTLVVEAI